MPIAEHQWQAWRLRLQEVVSEKRYKHCLRVAEEAAALARHYGLDEEKARMAGLLHDVARDLPAEGLIESARQFGIELGEPELTSPIILHAPVGAAILAAGWQLDDEELLTAVSQHTVACPHMSQFSAILYLADLIEPGRKKWPELPRLRAFCYQDLNLAMIEALEGNFCYLTANRLFIHPRACEAYEFFQEQACRQERA